MAVEVGLGQVNVADRAEVNFKRAAIGGVEICGLWKVVCICPVSRIRGGSGGGYALKEIH